MSGKSKETPPSVEPDIGPQSASQKKQRAISLAQQALEKAQTDGERAIASAALIRARDMPEFDY